jgi:hypothetical protein
MFTEIQVELFESPDLTLSDFYLWDLMERGLQKKGGYKRQIARSHFGSSCPHTEMWTLIQKKKRHLHTRVFRSTEVDGRIFEHLLRSVTN